MMFKSFKQSMMKEFDMTDLCRMRYFLGLEVFQRVDGIFICQRKYAQRCCNGSTWLIVMLYLIPSFQVLSWSKNPPAQQLIIMLRYIKGTFAYGIFYKHEGNEELLGYTDSDYAGDLEDRKSTSGFLFLLSSEAISWSSKKQPVVTLSTIEAEFIAAISRAC